VNATETSLKPAIWMKASCAVVVALMIASMAYAAITALSQYGSIGV
jgi:hypothetical protein